MLAGIARSSPRLTGALRSSPGLSGALRSSPGCSEPSMAPKRGILVITNWASQPVCDHNE
eukprot:2276474-Alexandrium_andersonii.AAC.1